MAFANFMSNRPQIFVTFIILLLLRYTEGVPKREILNSENFSPEENIIKHESKSDQLPSDNSKNPMEIMVRSLLEEILGTTDTRTLDSLSSIPSTITSMISSIFSSFGGLGGTTSNSSFSTNITSFLPSLGSLSSLGGGGCDLIDPLLIANLPGMFILTPIVIGALAIMIKIIVFIVIIIPKFAGPIFESITEKIRSSKQQQQGGWSQSIGNQYGAPSSSYGSPANSRLEGNIEAVTQSFAQAYDKYSNLQQNEYQYEGANPNQYYQTQWNTQSQ
ncbi:unnamed protein product [Orchesella dallaii]|uniref:Uncharacterized protein n=1 Tax=Orchesella dallaii TaxID=48710 RepID=A0ABP1QWB4_9HEXA